MCPSTCFSRTNCLLSKYNAEGKLDCFNCKTGLFSDYLLQCLQKKAITIHVFGEKISTPLWGIFNYYKEKLSVPRVQIAVLIESLATAP